MSQQSAIEALNAALPQINAGQKGFAESLLTQFKNKGTLSSKQWYWVKKLAEDATAAPVAPEEISVGANLDGVLALFAKAATKLKWPAIVLQFESGEEVKLSRAGDNSKNPGHIYVRVEPHGYIGKVSKDGKFYPTITTPAGYKEKATALLTKLAADPAGVAAEYGKLTGRCCFCAKELTDHKSIAVGYGPTCAKNYGLPYGVAAAAAAELGITPAIKPAVPLETIPLAAPEKPVSIPAFQLPLDLDGLIAAARGA